MGLSMRGRGKSKSTRALAPERPGKTKGSSRSAARRGPLHYPPEEKGKKSVREWGWSLPKMQTLVRNGENRGGIYSAEVVGEVPRHA